MRLDNDILIINKTDLDHILMYLENDILQREDYIKDTGKEIDELVLSECFTNGLQIELALNGIEKEDFKEIKLMLS